MFTSIFPLLWGLLLTQLCLCRKGTMPCFMGTFYANSSRLCETTHVSHCSPGKHALWKDFHSTTKSPHVAVRPLKGWHHISPPQVKWSCSEQAAFSVVTQVMGGLYPRDSLSPFLRVKSGSAPGANLTLGAMGFQSWKHHHSISPYIHKESGSQGRSGHGPQWESPFIVNQAQNLYL